jgi:hypothetical protein
MYGYGPNPNEPSAFLQTLAYVQQPDPNQIDLLLIKALSLCRQTRDTGLCGPTQWPTTQNMKYSVIIFMGRPTKSLGQVDQPSGSLGNLR